ncbi:MAG TPA: GNAT family N-acetyltransferase [Polyangia bacterium]|nr:GNAT family N-acetyltransferase [Polyangia bacterium]
MGEPGVLRTERLVLRPWRDDDLPPFAALNADPRVREHFPACLSRVESDASAAKIRSAFEAQGYGLWAVEVVGVAPFIGFIGLAEPGFSAPFTPCVEIGWRLAHAHWGRGYATEGARAALAFGFGPAGLAEIVSMTTPANTRSRHVMEKLGMHRDPAEDFDHPNLAPGSPARRHVLYRLRAPRATTG